MKWWRSLISPTVFLKKLHRWEIVIGNFLKSIWPNILKEIAWYVKIALAFIICFFKTIWREKQVDFWTVDKQMPKEKRSRHLTTPFRQNYIYIHTPDTWQMTAYASPNCFRIPLAIFGTRDCRMHTASGKTQGFNLGSLNRNKVSVNKLCVGNVGIELRGLKIVLEMDGYEHAALV